MENSDLMKEEEVFARINKKRSALYRLKKANGFPLPVLTHPAMYSRSAVERWIAEGGVNRSS